MKSKGIIFGIVLALIISSIMPVTDTSAAVKKAKIDFSQKNVVIEVGANAVISLQYEANNITKDVKWSTTSKNVAMELNPVGETGAVKITGLKTGTATIKAKYKTKTYSCKIKIVKSTVGLKYKSNASSGAKLCIFDAKSTPGLDIISANSKIKFTGFVGKKGYAEGECIITATNSKTFLTSDSYSNSFTIYGNFSAGLPQGCVFIDFPNSSYIIANYVDGKPTKLTYYTYSGAFIDYEIGFESDSWTDYFATVREYNADGSVGSVKNINGSKPVTLAE